MFIEEEGIAYCPHCEEPHKYWKHLGDKTIGQRCNDCHEWFSVFGMGKPQARLEVTYNREQEMIRRMADDGTS